MSALPPSPIEPEPRATPAGAAAPEAPEAPAPAANAPTVPERLISAAIRIFAAKGFAKASTREICQAAGANVAAIHYYFGGKEGLYQAVLAKPVKDVVSLIPCDPDGHCDGPPPTMQEALRVFYSAFLTPLMRGGDEFADLRRLTLREMVEPTQAYADVLHQNIAPEHHALVEMLAQHCGAAGPDDALHQLAFALVAIVENYWMSLDYLRLLAPSLLNGPQAHEQLVERLVGYGMALVEHERRQRQPQEN
jgi:AcrR family transcriptional regulator